jgi:hypothetical protein
MQLSTMLPEGQLVIPVRAHAPTPQLVMTGT